MHHEHIHRPAKPFMPLACGAKCLPLFSRDRLTTTSTSKHPVLPVTCRVPPVSCAQPEEAPLLDAIRARGSRPESSFHVPGHKVTHHTCAHGQKRRAIMIDLALCSEEAQPPCGPDRLLEIQHSSTISPSYQVCTLT